MKAAPPAGGESISTFHRVQRIDRESSFAPCKLKSVSLGSTTQGRGEKRFRVFHGAMRYMGCFELVSLMCMNRTVGVGRHTRVIPEAPGLEPWESSQGQEVGEVAAISSNQR